MKRLTIIFCLFLSVHALAQSGDTTHKAASKPAAALAYKTDPLIVVDNAVYKGTINSISPSDIQDITILKGNHATDAYGRMPLQEPLLSN